MAAKKREEDYYLIAVHRDDLPLLAHRGHSYTSIPNVREALHAAKLAGTKLPDGTYVFRSNEQAADLAALVLGIGDDPPEGVTGYEWIQALVVPRLT